LVRASTLHDKHSSLGYCPYVETRFPTVWRNWVWAYYNKGVIQSGLACFDKAFQLDPADARVLFEQDSIAQKPQLHPQARQEELERYPHL
jgi:hypothetical protein